MKKIKFIATLAILFITISGFSQKRVGATCVYPQAPFNLQEGDYAQITCTWTTSDGLEINNTIWLWSSVDELPYYTFVNNSPFTEFKSTKVKYEVWYANRNYCIGSKVLPNFVGIVTFTGLTDVMCLSADTSALD